jgi:hypothetical protein
MNLSEICCSVNDIKGIQKWWEEPISTPSETSQNQNLSRSDIRKRKLMNVSTFTREILKRNDKLVKLAEDFLADNYVDNYCKNSAKDLIANQSLVTKLIDRYEEESARCWDFTNELQTSLMCAACDIKAQRYLDFENSEISINSDSFKAYTSSCKQMLLLNTQKLYPWFEI